MSEREREVEPEPVEESAYERERALYRDSEPGPDMDGEELVDGTGGGTENVIDAEHATPGTGRLIGGIVVGLLAFVLIALPVAWAIGVLALLSGSESPAASVFTWVYASLLVLLGAIAAFYAYTLLRERRHA